MAPPAGAPASAPLPRVEELVLRGADVSVLNHTTLSLWHFRQLALEMLPPAEREEDQKAPEPSRGIELGEGMSVAAVLFEQPPRPEKSEQEDAGHRTGRARPALQLQTSVQGHLTPDTRVAAVFQRYRCVLCLDASPSILSIDPSSGRLFLDLLYESVELLIWSMLRPMEVGGLAFTPELHVSVLVQGALVESLCVIMQGYIVTPANAASFLQLIKDRFQLIENDWAAQAQELGQWGYLGNATPASLDWILQNAVFALNSLPSDCAPMVVLVTDGVVDVRDAYSYDNLLMQLVRHDIQCHFLRIGGGGEDELSATFGFVPDTHLLRFVAEYTGGTVFDYAAIHEACYGTTSTCSNVAKKMTGLQDSCFLRKSSVHANSAPVVKLNEMDSTSFDGRTFFHRPPSTIIPTIQSRKVEPSGGYSLVITTQPLTRKPLDKDSVQLLLLKSTPSALGVGNAVLPVERALQEAQLFTRELFHVAAQHYERDLLWSRLLFDDTRGPGAEVARTLALPTDLFRVEVGPQQLEECLRLSICTPLETLDPRLDELLRVSGVCWQELALRLRDIYADQLREFQFQEEDENSSHLLLLCPDTFDLIIHLTFITPKDQAVAQPGTADDGDVSASGDGSIDSSSRSASINGSHVGSVSEQFSDGGFEAEVQGDVRVEICRREEPPNKQFTFAQRRSISEFVNCIVHWQWRSLIYD
ncbi:Dynein heavy chain 1 [Phytophthora cinnamomi]|uniref:Dynein heavy chain 1 n=1 Tax=Phytophthora cinnamomi TaxID=4785 RepID=UPI00355A3BD0|nr:Dynein heavy chain 1 [Phytophthora cinnamomi]